MRSFATPTSIPWLAYGFSLLALELIFGHFFSATHGVGHDYGFFMPYLLDNYYWFLNNGLFSPPWFTPAFCAGLPAYADPQSLYYSPLQFLSFVFPPLTAIHLTLLLYVSLGYLGMYLLCRQRLGVSLAGALFAAVLWMLNGFVTHRMVIGHFSFVGVALIPLIAWLMSSPSPRWQIRGLSILAASSLLASWVYSGLGALLVPATLSVLALLCLTIVRGQAAQTIYRNAILVATTGISLAASKLLAMTALVSNLPRSHYPLMGFGSVADLLLANLASIALPSAWAQTIAWPLVQNRFTYLDIHEWTLTLTPIPLLLIAAALIGYLPVWHRRNTATSTPFSSTQYIHLILLLAFLTPTLAVQLYEPSWNALLKQIPIIKSTSNPFRWTVALLPVLCALAALSADKLAPRRTWYLVLPACMAVILCIAVEPRDFYEQQDYDATPVSLAFEQAHQPGFTPRIEKTGAHITPDGEIVLLPNRNDLITEGISQAFCYNPLFGYGLENFDPRDLGPGSMARDLSGHLNMKNPVCYVFPEENQCMPGDHFLSAQKSQAEQLMHYRAVTFKRPLRQQIADRLSLGTLLLMLMLAAFAAIRLPRK